MLPRRNEGFLRNIFALAEVAQPAVSQRANQGLVARHDATEGVAVAGQTARDKFCVAVFLCDHRSVGYHTVRYVPGNANQVTNNITARAQGIQVISGLPSAPVDHKCAVMSLPFSIWIGLVCLN